MKYRIISFLIIIVLTNSVKAQFSAGGGFSSYKSFGADFTRYGINIFYERPRNEVNTFYLRGIFTLPIKNFTEEFFSPIDFSAGNPTITVDKEVGTTLLSVDGGTRMYYFNTYDAGLAFYGSLQMRGILVRYRERYGDFDADLYAPPNELRDPSTSLLLGFGGNIGVKYQLPYKGALNLDIALDLVRTVFDPVPVLGFYTGMATFSVNAAYRFDWF